MVKSECLKVNEKQQGQPKSRALREGNDTWLPEPLFNNKCVVQLPGMWERWEESGFGDSERTGRVEQRCFAFKIIQEAESLRTKPSVGVHHKWDEARFELETMEMVFSRLGGLATLNSWQGMRGVVEGGWERVCSRKVHEDCLTWKKKLAVWNKRWEILGS